MAAEFFGRPRHRGKNYRKLLTDLHRIRQPASYLEIGTDTGKTLRLAKCPTIAIDPKFRFAPGERPSAPNLHLFEQTSDAFFAGSDPGAILGRSIDLAFIDGMHRFEFALRDFLNVERFCRGNSLIVLHDCLPIDAHMARIDPHDRSLESLGQYPGAWAGDTWKVIWVLQRWRPDLLILPFDAKPSGLVVVTNLDPGSTTLRDAYDEVVRSAADVTLRQFYEGIDVLPTSSLKRSRSLAGWFRWRRDFDLRHYLRPAVLAPGH